MFVCNQKDANNDIDRDRRTGLDRDRGPAKICPENAASKPGGHVWSLLQAPRPDIFHIFFDGFLAIQRVFWPENTLYLP